MVSNQRKKGRDKARAARTGASRASAATGNVHRHDPVPDMSMLNDLPYAAGNPLNLDFAGRLVAACRAGCAPCQDTLTRKVVDRHRPTLAALAGAVCGLEMNTILQYSPTVSATDRSWALLAQHASESRDGSTAYAAVEAMDATQAGQLLDDVLNHWAAGGAEPDEITAMLNTLRAGPPRRGPADPMTPFREAGVRELLATVARVSFR
ncbi:hypothetical protein ABZY45_19845 [Streptomyces sp. NPDC006516]|uniref:hypothetical protein n=1 Tax=Streptomyces sp. NPDC006516 TaxID=3154309 RepID=UPI0033B3A7CA